MPQRKIICPETAAFFALAAHHHNPALRARRPQSAAVRGVPGLAFGIGAAVFGNGLRASVFRRAHGSLGSDKVRVTDGVSAGGCVLWLNGATVVRFRFSGNPITQTLPECVCLTNARSAAVQACVLILPLMALSPRQACFHLNHGHLPQPCRPLFDFAGHLARYWHGALR